MNNTLTPDQQIKFNILTKVYMAEGKNLLEAKLALLAKERDDIDAAAAEVKRLWERGQL